MDGMSNIQAGNTLKSIDLKAKSFFANGKEYFIESSLSFERYLMYQKLQIELGYDIGFYGIFKKVEEIYGLCNQMKFAEIAVITHNIMNGVKTVDTRRIPALELCSLFINAADEDRKVINDDMVQQKISDWEAEGLDILPFFQLALNSIKDFTSVYSELFQSISEKQ